TRSSGTGLGLAICAQIAHFHNASLSIDSSPGKGTSVILKIPA
ncbi:MAG: ATP-binding protein, partial [Elusimicrobiota bacterium]